MHELKTGLRVRGRVTAVAVTSFLSSLTVTESSALFSEHLSAASQAEVKLTLEINAAPKGFDDRVRRVVNDGGQLGAESKEFE